MKVALVIQLLVLSQSQPQALCECQVDDEVVLIQTMVSTYKRVAGADRKKLEALAPMDMSSSSWHTVGPTERQMNASSWALLTGLQSEIKYVSEELAGLTTSSSVAKYVASRTGFIIYPRHAKVILGAALSAIILIFLICVARTTAPLENLRIQSNKGSADASKWIKRDVPYPELKTHASEGSLWIAIEGVVCDLTEFAATHPGGSELLWEHAGKDGSEAFHEIGHSAFASELARTYAVGKLVDACESAFETGGEKEASAQGTLSRLTSNEDPLHFHKIFGSLCLLNYACRIGWLLAAVAPEGSDPCGLGPDYFSLVSVWLHAFLQCSSFAFKVPRARVRGNPMIWQEYRGHNCIFVMRHVFAFTLSWAVQREEGVTGNVTGLKQAAMAGMVTLLFSAMFAADMVTEHFRADEYESTTSTMPYWAGCPLWAETFFKGYYTWAQLQAGFGLMAVPGTKLYLNFILMLPIQLASFLLTLVRKGFISATTFHCIYFWSLAQVFVCWIIQEEWPPFVFVVWVPAFILRLYGFPKYLLWLGIVIPFAMGVLWDPDDQWLALTMIGVWGAVALLSALLQPKGSLFAHRERRFVEERPKPLVLQHRERISSSLYWLRFRLPDGYISGVMAGQHVRLLVPNPSFGLDLWNGVDNVEKAVKMLSRSYTPVCAPASPTVDLLVRHYFPNESSGFSDGGRASALLADKIQPTSEVLVSGPHGQPVYKGGRFRVGTGYVKARHCCALVGGSGITPILAILRAIRAEQRNCAATDTVKGVETVRVLHATRGSDEALSPTWYNPDDEIDIAPSCHVCNLVTGKAPGGSDKDPFLVGQISTTQYGKVSESVIMDFFPDRAEDVVLLVCGPKGFVDFSLPLVKAAGFSNVATLL